MWNMKCMIVRAITGATGIEKCGNLTGKTFNRFTSKGSYTCNISRVICKVLQSEN
jgi:hypothetical protein